MKQVRCKSGLIGWQARLRASYDNDPDSWKWYDEHYGLAKRLGYGSAQAAWEANPLIEGSTDPRDFRVVDGRQSWKYRGCRIAPETGKSRYFGLVQGVHGRIMYRTRYWRVNFPDGTWTFCGTKVDARDYINQPRNDYHLRAS